MKLVSVLLAGAAALLVGCSSNSPSSLNNSPPSPVPTRVLASQTPSAPVASSSSTPPSHPPFNVLLVTIDSLRADMPWNGYPRDIAPHLTELFPHTVRYPHAYAVSSFTSKSVPAFLSGHYPSELYRTTPFFTQYTERNEFLAEGLHRLGVHTLAGQAHRYLAKNSGLAQGFDRWELVPGIEFDANKDPYVTSQKLTPLAISMLSDATVSSGRFFGFFHFMDPHDVYQPHAESPKFGNKPRDLYDQEVFFTDLWVDKLFQFVREQPWGANTAIIVSADHGEAFGEHGLTRHAFELYDVLVHVPLMFVVPGAKAREVPAWRSQIDLAPTIYDLLGLPVPEGLPGQSLVPEILGQDLPARPILCDLPADTNNQRRRALIEGGWKLIAFGNDYRFEMYDLENDPDEKANLYRKDKERAAQMLERYRQLSHAVHDVPAQGGSPVMK